MTIIDQARLFDEDLKRAISRWPDLIGGLGVSLCVVLDIGARWISATAEDVHVESSVKPADINIAAANCVDLLHEDPQSQAMSLFFSGRLHVQGTKETAAKVRAFFARGVAEDHELHRVFLTMIDFVRHRVRQHHHDYSPTSANVHLIEQHIGTVVHPHPEDKTHDRLVQMIADTQSMQRVNEGLSEKDIRSLLAPLVFLVVLAHLGHDEDCLSTHDPPVRRWGYFARCLECHRWTIDPDMPKQGKSAGIIRASVRTVENTPDPFADLSGTERAMVTRYIEMLKGGR